MTKRKNTPTADQRIIDEIVNQVKASRNSADDERLACAKNIARKLSEMPFAVHKQVIWNNIGLPVDSAVRDFLIDNGQAESVLKMIRNYPADDQIVVFTLSGIIQDIHDVDQYGTRVARTTSDNEPLSQHLIAVIEDMPADKRGGVLLDEKNLNLLLSFKRPYFKAVTRMVKEFSSDTQKHFFLRTACAAVVVEKITERQPKSQFVVAKSLLRMIARFSPEDQVNALDVLTPRNTEDLHPEPQRRVGDMMNEIFINRIDNNPYMDLICSPAFTIADRISYLSFHMTPKQLKDSRRFYRDTRKWIDKESELSPDEIHEAALVDNRIFDEHRQRQR